MPPPAASTAKPPLFKIVMLGDSGVGKTSLVCKLTNPSASMTTDVPATMGIEFDTQLVTTSQGSVKAQIWDTAGQERFARVLLPTYFRKARGVFLVFDMTNPESLKSIEARWMGQIDDHADAASPLFRILVANKSDLASAASAPTLVAGEVLALKHGMAFVAASAKTGENVQAAFEQLLDGVARVKTQPSAGANKAGVSLKSQKIGQQSTGCC